ncbi:hypothetical protein [Sphaerobacter sp.]|uniref:hypothetical protein n=1 Tax=Sphaerobacter sp. TaxID=2099654 RepID=UPI001DF26158|nr:hypothetical protein [Sphaerobacter sp.]MBX5445859.1 hypothetical protein [Sphaerobacter sp.]
MVAIFRRRQRHEDGDAQPTTADLRAQRAAEWARHFSGPAGLEDYRKAFLRYSPLFWDIVESTQRELLALLVNRVPADLGVPAIFALSLLYSRHGKPDDAARATLAIIVNDLSPAHARTLLATLSDAWHNAQRCPYDERPAAILAEVRPALRRLQTTSAEETGAISAIQEQIAFGWEEE